MRVTPELDVIDTIYICNQAGGQNTPALAFNGENYLTVWYDPGLNKGIVAARVTPQGAVLDTGNCLGAGDDDPDVASDSNRGLAVWSRDYYGVCGRFLDRQAMPADTVMLVAPIAASGTSPRIACDGQNYLVVWADFGSGGDLDVFGRLVTGQGQLPGEIFPVARGTAVQQDPNLCFDGNKYITIWLEDGSRIIGQFIGLDGKLIGGPFHISDTTVHERQYPALAAFDDNYLAVWAEYHGGFDIYAALGNAINISERGAERRSLLSVSPNPFRTTTNICMGQSVPLRGSGVPETTSRIRSARESFQTSLQDFPTKGIELKIYDTVGRLVNSFALRNSPYALRWGQSVPPGVYFARSTDGQQVKVIKVK